MIKVLEGRNKATYFINTKNLSALIESLKFYAPIGFEGKILKILLFIVTYIESKLFKKNLKTSCEIKLELQQILKHKIDFEFYLNSSALVSPTRDKVIINNHNQSFIKYASNQSYDGVKKEIEIYKLFKKKPKSFQVSKLTEYINYGNCFCKFKLDNKHICSKKTKKFDMSLVLAEFFNYGTQKKVSVAYYSKFLISKLNQNTNATQISFLNKIKQRFGVLEFSLGLTHNDFKPWNIKAYSKPLIFDFEEANINGLPLSDLINFKLDPIITNSSNFNILTNILLKETTQNDFNKYKKQIGINLPTEIFIYFYLTERIIFWRTKNPVLSEKYIRFFNIITYKLSTRNDE